MAHLCVGYSVASARVGIKDWGMMHLHPGASAQRPFELASLCFLYLASRFTGCHGKNAEFLVVFQSNVWSSGDWPFCTVSSDLHLDHGERQCLIWLQITLLI
jgi:hypothetical protein